MCRICGSEQCGTVDLYQAAARPISDAVAALKAAGFKAIGVQVMAHESKGPGPTVQELGEQAAAAHERQHGVAKANDNLNLTAPEAAEVDDGEPAVKAKAQKPVEDK